MSILKTRIALRPVNRVAPLVATLKRHNITPLANSEEYVPFSIERVFFLLRWLIIGLAFAIQLYVASGRSGPEAFARAIQLSAVIAMYNGLFLGLRYYARRRNDRAKLAIIDAAFTSVIAGLGGGIYSPFLVLAYLIVVEASLFFTASNTLTFAALVGVMYMTAALFLPGQQWTELSITIVMTEVLAMFIMASIGTSLVKALEQQRELARHEQELANQLNHQVVALSALNRLSEKLNSSLNINELMQNTVESLPDALSADACVIFLASRNSANQWLIDKVWHDVTVTFEAQELLSHPGYVQAGSLFLSQTDLVVLLEENNPLLLADDSAGSVVQLVPLGTNAEEKGVLALIRHNGPLFSETDRDLVVALARQLALLVKNARLYELERENVVRLQELEQMKSDFLSVVSHELRTPLTSIKASTMLMLAQPDDEISPTGSQLLKNIDRNTERLSALVTDLLDMAKLQNGRLKLNLQLVNLSEVINDAVTAIKPLVARKNQQLELVLQAKEAVLVADRRRIEQVVTNLLSNAYRYTPHHGKITVLLCEQPDCVIISVSDNGPGIAAHERELVFERFYRTESQRATSGTGLGLSIARSLVELHGGQIWVEAGTNKGSIFSFCLPKQVDGTKGAGG